MHNSALWEGTKKMQKMKINDLESGLAQISSHVLIVVGGPIIQESQESAEYQKALQTVVGTALGVIFLVGIIALIFLLYRLRHQRRRPRLGNLQCGWCYKHQQMLGCHFLTTLWASAYRECIGVLQKARYTDVFDSQVHLGLTSCLIIFQLRKIIIMFI